MLPNACPKPARGSYTLAREAAEAEATELEIAVKKVVKARDGKCRWPQKHKCRKGLECAHLKDASLGGEIATFNLILLCGWLHRRGPESIHSKDLKIEPLTERGADGPCAFFVKIYSETRLGEYRWRCVARERAVGIVERASK